MAASTIISALTLGTVVVGGLWAYYRLYKRREHAVRLDFTTVVNFVGVQDGKWLISLDAHVNNEGLVRHEITRFDMELRCLLKTSFVLLHGYLDYRDGGHSAEVLAAVSGERSPAR